MEQSEIAILLFGLNLNKSVCGVYSMSRFNPDYSLIIMFIYTLFLPLCDRILLIVHVGSS